MHQRNRNFPLLRKETQGEKIMALKYRERFLRDYDITTPTKSDLTFYAALRIYGKKSLVTEDRKQHWALIDVVKKINDGGLIDLEDIDNYLKQERDG